MEKFNKLEFGNNKVVLLANTTKSDDYFFNGNFISVFINNGNGLPIIINLKSATGTGRGMPIHGKIENIAVSDFGFLVFEYNKSANDIELNVVLQ
jgi:hypothetical protein